MIMYQLGQKHAEINGPWPLNKDKMARAKGKIHGTYSCAQPSFRGSRQDKRARPEQETQRFTSPGAVRLS